MKAEDDDDSPPRWSFQLVPPTLLQYCSTVDTHAKKLQSQSDKNNNYIFFKKKVF